MPDSAANRISWQQYDLTVNRYLGSGGSGYGNNNSHDDPASDIIAAWLCEAADIWAESITGGDMDLVDFDGGSYLKAADTTNYVQGASSFKHSFANLTDNLHYDRIDDDKLIIGFPYKSDAADRIMTIGYWFRVHNNYDNLTVTTPPPGSSDSCYIGSNMSKSGWVLNIDCLTERVPSGDPEYGVDGKVQVELLATQNTSYPFNFTHYEHASSFDQDKWYHVVLRVNATSYNLSVWDPVAQAIVGSDLAGSHVGNIGIWNDHFLMWSAGDTTGEFATNDESLGSFWYDEIIVSDKWLSDADVLKIRQGAYP